jgi:hypothetical protein
LCLRVKERRQAHEECAQQRDDFKESFFHVIQTPVKSEQGLAVTFNRSVENFRL